MYAKSGLFVIDQESKFFLKLEDLLYMEVHDVGYHLANYINIHTRYGIFETKVDSNLHNSIKAAASIVCQSKDYKLMFFMSKNGFILNGTDLACLNQERFAYFAYFKPNIRIEIDPIFFEHNVLKGLLEVKDKWVEV